MKTYHSQLISIATGIVLFAAGMNVYAQDSAQNTAAENAKVPVQNTKEEASAPVHYNSISEIIAKTNPALAAAPKADNANSKKGVVSEDARQYVDAIQKYYDNAKTYSATFDQDYETVDGVKKASSGVVWFKKPGMMRWDYEKPESRFLISDGKFLWSWEPVYRQYCKQDMRASQLPTALSFLTGTGKIEDEFSVKLNKVDGNQVYLELTPTVPSLAYESIKFEILMPTAKVYRATIYDAMGNMNRITFKSPELNAELDNSSFHFDPPTDARHICE